MFSFNFSLFFFAICCSVSINTTKLNDLTPLKALGGTDEFIVDDDMIVVTEPGDSMFEQEKNTFYKKRRDLYLPSAIDTKYKSIKNISKQQCLSTKGMLGICMSMKECYPYFRIYDLPSSETWIMGLENSCTFLTEAGYEVFGVCCVNDSLLTPAYGGGNFSLELMEEDLFDDHLTIEDEDYPFEAQVISGMNTCGNHYFKSLKDNFDDYDWKPETYSDKDGFHLTRIVNGHEVAKHSYPFMAAIFNRGKHFCGGSLIDHKHILTACHCVSRITSRDIRKLSVFLGDHDITTPYDVRHQEFKIRRIVRNKRFNSQSLWNDVAIITLKKNVTFSRTIQPICLPGHHKTYAGKSMTVAGWGTLADGGRQPKRLHSVEVKVWNNSNCAASYGSDAPGGIRSHMLCASNPNKDSCSGDSGGPLFTCDPYCQQIGIVSWGIGCARAEYPGVYTRISALMPWIVDKVNKY